jgi:hypothetical protein
VIIPDLPYSDVREATGYPYGERQYTVEDPSSHRWAFSEAIADVDPKSWVVYFLRIDHYSGKPCEML